MCQKLKKSELINSENQADKLLGIGEVAKLLNTTTRTIRYYEELGMVYPFRVDGVDSKGPRRYDSRHIAILRFHLHCRKLGISIKELMEISRSYYHVDCKLGDKLVLETLDKHLGEVEKKLEVLEEIRKGLLDMIEYEKENSVTQGGPAAPPNHPDKKEGKKSR